MKQYFKKIIFLFFTTIMFVVAVNGRTNTRYPENINMINYYDSANETNKYGQIIQGNSDHEDTEFVSIKPFVGSKLTPTERKVLFHSINDAFKEYGQFYPNQTQPNTRYDTIRGLNEDLNDPNNSWLEATIKNKRVGGTFFNNKLVSVNEGENEDALYFGTLWVDKNMRGQGIAQKLVWEIEIIARSKGAKKILMAVLNAHKKLKNFYIEKFGYQVKGAVSSSGYVTMVKEL